MIKRRANFYEAVPTEQMLPDSVITRVEADFAAINRHWQDPETLSAIALRLTDYFNELGDLVTEAEFEMDNAKAIYEHNVDSRKLELIKKGDSATAAETQAKVEHKEDKDASLEAKRKYGLLKRKREALEKRYEATRSRVSLIKLDIRAS